jgi:hypothetical protein
LYGTCSIVTFAWRLKSSPAIWPVEPAPAVAYDSSPGRALRELNEILHRAHRERWRHDHYHRHQAGQRDAGEILQRIVAGVGEERGHGCERVSYRQQRITVRRRFRDELRSDEAARPRPVLDDDLLLQAFRHRLRERPGDDVQVAARRQRHDQTDRLARILLSRRECGHQHCDGRGAKA